jgi:hypothetical protein
MTLKEKMDSIFRIYEIGNKFSVAQACLQQAAFLLVMQLTP